ncbi:MAG: serpin family protein [Candidatus Woesearchaeota archaeon]|nr:MAG: serpin family protein [Candidatus Woesearchaeota archaeon]
MEDKNIILIGIVIFAIVLSCVLYLTNFEVGTGDIGSGTGTSRLSDIGATVGSVESIVEANNLFALEYYSEIKDDGGNIFFSPYSISTALAMVYEGAKGQTAEEIVDVFHFPEDNDARRPSFARIYNEINKENKSYALSTANALWAQKDYTFLESYLKTMETYYGGKVTNLDFVEDTENSRQTINKWVEEQTNDKIKNLIPKGFLHDMTRLVLTNAIYFKGTWVKQFDEKNTREEDFTTSEGSVKAEMMRLTGEEAKFSYAETDKLQVLELPYDGNDLSMLILLPKDDLASIENEFTVENLNKWKNMLENQRVDIYIPKFTFETKYFMSNDLKKMGMTVAFSENADFSGMDGTRMLFIDFVIHQAFVEVNEEGTEAAAATGVGMALTSLPIEQKVFRADHPFIFIIQDRETGNILFIGRMSNPSS